jgi:hypothetical protein
MIDKTWEDFEDDVNEMTQPHGLFETLFQVWLAEGGTYKPALREDLDRKMRMEGSFLQKAKITCPHGATPLTCNKCYFDNQ